MLLSLIRDSGHIFCIYCHPTLRKEINQLRTVMICSSGSVLREHYQPVVKKITERSMRNSRQVTTLCIIIKTSSMAYIVADFMAQPRWELIDKPVVFCELMCPWCWSAEAPLLFSLELFLGGGGGWGDRRWQGHRELGVVSWIVDSGGCQWEGTSRVGGFDYSVIW